MRTAMTRLHITLGNKNYSSWSLRPWLVMEHLGLSFDEAVIPLFAPESRAQLAQASPSGLVPVLRDGDLVIWESLAICEYLAERYPDAGLWPRDPALRALARSVSCEMHGGFVALRTHMPMDLRASRPGAGRGPGVEQNIARVLQLWDHCMRARGQAGVQGEFLLGPFGIVDAMFAPVVSRFRTYAVELSGQAEAYAKCIEALPALARWREAARAEPWTIPAAEG